MPNRIVRVGFLDSEAIHALSDAAECFYHRLMLAVDDAGRFDARIEILRSILFPLDSGRRRGDVENHLRECVGVSLVYTYEWNKKPFLQLTRWQRCGKAVQSRFPDRDGGYAINYVELETRDGRKEFVASSLPMDPMPMPCPPHADGVERQIKKTNTGTYTNTETGTGGGFASPPHADGVSWPTLKEWTEAAKIDGLVEWKAVEEWHYQEKLDPPWKGVGSWRKHLTHTRVKWEHAGRPMKPARGAQQQAEGKAELAALNDQIKLTPEGPEREQMRQRWSDTKRRLGL